MDGRITKIVPIDINNYILNCYWLAKHYQVDPRIFLSKTLTQVGRDLYWTKELLKGDAAEAAWQEKLRKG